jgi:hypothetical protein
VPDGDVIAGNTAATPHTDKGKHEHASDWFEDTNVPDGDVIAGNTAATPHTDKGKHEHASSWFEDTNVADGHVIAGNTAATQHADMKHTGAGGNIPCADNGEHESTSGGFRRLKPPAISL